MSGPTGCVNPYHSSTSWLQRQGRYPPQQPQDN
ncbi:unnamed protein product, partial [Rotaria sp. Silwood1]